MDRHDQYLESERPEDRPDEAPEPMGAATATADARPDDEDVHVGTPPPASAPPDERDLITGADREEFQRRWEGVMAGFVDDPRATTEEADSMVGELLDRLTRRREELRTELRGDGADTERMRLVLRRYRVLYRAVVGG